MRLKSSILEKVFFQSRIPQMIFDYNFKDNVANEAFFQFIGYSKEEWDEVTLREISHPEDYQLDMQLYHEVFTGKRPSYQMEKRYFHKSGEIIWGSLNVTSIEDPDSQKKYFLAQIYDITEQKNLERVLTDNEQKYRLLADNSSDIINLYLPDGRFLYSSPSITQILGYDTDELTGDVPYHYIHPEDISYVQKKHMSLLENHHPILITYRFKHKNDTYIWVESSIRSIADEKTGEITGLISISRDITSRLEKDKLLQKSEKLAVVGQLAAAVAHEIRNPLTSIKGFIQLFSQTKECNEEYMKIVRDELNRVEEIISEFLTMARPQQEKNETLNIDELINQVITLLNTQAILVNKEIKYENVAANPLVRGDKNQLKQVFYQIIQNGLDALEEKGTVYIHLSANDGIIKVKVKDNGRGIPNERLKNIGEPYYSIKEKGTGFGLMTSFQIIENHQGRIEIDSIVGQGTVVSVTLPM
ncbi:PAS domain S-box protein [Metabacillus halosaccharovorans]|uniref:histidine kinase n=1 Tax=Metabacillus halosaccharovorans TaxID=930124 RepID=A0ABT3DET4_9BACI|nr:PAS domain S-box protein [Metabacillus halosaccharovorans]MCV9885467.1 PAS domain S-box protein [Metabacillus halosaccharovorans]